LVEFLWSSGYAPDFLRFDRHALRPSTYLVGYFRLSHCAWTSREMAVKPNEDQVYEIHAQRHASSGLGRREREVPEVTKTVPSIYHFILVHLVYSGHPCAVLCPL
jgi:hypothetical protein